MKRIYHHIIAVVSAALFAQLTLLSCIYEDEEEQPTVQPGNIGVHAGTLDGSRRGEQTVASGEDAFMLLFWLQEHLAKMENLEGGNPFDVPYLATKAPQHVAYYDIPIYDTEYPYPYPADTRLFATGYAPANMLEQTDNYRKLALNAAALSVPLQYGRYDCLGCDLWRDVFSGSGVDPFAQDKNKLYFRHLAAKLVFYATRDEATMENRQYVRNVSINNLRMKVGDGAWTGSETMHTPSEFTWKTLDPLTDITAAYQELIGKIKTIPGNTAVTSVPAAGYKASASLSFAGTADYVLQKNATDRVPVYGMVIDSCYVCNPITDGTAATGHIRLKMDISAEMSYDPHFPDNADDPHFPDNADGSTVSNMTFVREWNDVELEAINEVELLPDGQANVTNRAVEEFKAGNEYRVYIHFTRTGVNLAARELPWDYGGIHYITIQGGNATE